MNRILPDDLEEAFKTIYNFTDKQGFDEDTADKIVDLVSDGYIYLMTALQVKEANEKASNWTRNRKG